MDPLDLVGLTAIMERTSGSADVTIGLIDGPVLTDHPDLASEQLRELPGARGAACARPTSAACLHGTFVAGMLAARRGSSAAAIAPGCTFVVRPVFAETNPGSDVPGATPGELAAALTECMDAGVRVVNLSLAIEPRSTREERALEDALDEAMRRGVVVVAAAGNQGIVGSSTIVRHPWVVPVVACTLAGRPMSESNLGASIGRRGLCAPGDGVTSLGAGGRPQTLAGTSVAAPFVTGAIALLWSEFPAARASQIKDAVTRASVPRRGSIVPPLLNAGAADRVLSAAMLRGRTA
jgi:subtilisin family serine protease